MKKQRYLLLIKKRYIIKYFDIILHRNVQREKQLKGFCQTIKQAFEVKWKYGLDHLIAIYKDKMYQDYVSSFMMTVMVFFTKTNFILCVCYKDSCLKLRLVFQKCAHTYINSSPSHLYWILTFKGMNVLVWFAVLLNNWLVCVCNVCCC